MIDANILFPVVGRPRNLPTEGSGYDYRGQKSTSHKHQWSSQEKSQTSTKVCDLTLFLWSSTERNTGLGNT